jgi:hypothetical protein
MLALATVVSLALGGCSCPGEMDTGSQNELVVRSYAVAPEYGEELKDILHGMFHHGGDAKPLGSVRVSRDGLVVVAAPESMIGGIEEVISALDRSNPPPPPTVHLTYWAVEGVRSMKTTWPDHLAVLQEALTSVAAVDGPLAFALLEKIELSSLSGARASTDGPYFGVEQKATARNGVVYANLFLRKGPVMRMRTAVRIEPGQLMVLEQAGFASMVEKAPDLAEKSTYLIVQARVDETEAR